MQSGALTSTFRNADNRPSVNLPRPTSLCLLSAGRSAVRQHDSCGLYRASTRVGACGADSVAVEVLMTLKDTSDGSTETL
jgi:hypothetical protein